MYLGWSLALLLILCTYVTTCSPASKLKDEILSEYELHRIDPMYGLKQLQHAATMMHTLWNNGENNYNSEQPIERYVSTKQKVDSTTDYNNNRERGVTGEEVTELTDYNDSRKRDVPDNLKLCMFGVPQYNVTLQNTCAGYVCTVEEAVCKNRTDTYTIYPNATNIKAFPWSQCEVTKMLCFLNGRAESINMKEQYGVTNCSLIVDSVSCLKLQPFGLTCLVQVTCSNYTNWGTFAWGLQCETDRLNCNGTILRETRINSYQQEIMGGVCHIETVGCAERALARNCSKLNLTCGFQNDLGSYDRCNVRRLDVPCLQENSNSTNCTISQIICNGVIKDANEAHVNQSQCSIYSLNCNGTNTLIQSGCKPYQMVCNGTITYFATYNKSLSNCAVSQVRCGNSSNCTTMEFACPQAPKCTLTRLPCSVTCNRMLNTSSCICPDDYSGRFCDRQAQYNCSASLIYPPIKCLPPPTKDPKDSLLSGDRKCTVFDDYKGNAALAYHLDCAFAAPVNYSSINFTYWAKNDKISIFQEVSWDLRLKIFNFNRLFDTGGIFNTANLTAAQILGNEPVWFNFSLEQVPDRFWFARRLYYELRFNSGPSDNTTLGRNFIDAPSRPISTKTMSNITTFTLVIILGSIAVILGLVGYVSYKCYHSRRNALQKQKY